MRVVVVVVHKVGVPKKNLFSRATMYHSLCKTTTNINMTIKLVERLATPSSLVWNKEPNLSLKWSGKEGNDRLGLASQTKSWLICDYC